MVASLHDARRMRSPKVLTRKKSIQLRREKRRTYKSCECVLKALLDLETSLYVCVEHEGLEKLRRAFHPHDAVDLLLRLLQDRDAA